MIVAREPYSQKCINPPFRHTVTHCCAQVNLLRHPKLAVVKREHETGRNFQF